MTSFVNPRRLVTFIYLFIFPHLSRHAIASRVFDAFSFLFALIYIFQNKEQRSGLHERYIFLAHA